MNKEEYLKIQTCVLKVNIHCEGCKNKVKKILKKIEGVYKTVIDQEQGKVTVSGIVDADILIKQLTKHGKHATVWGAPPKPAIANNNNNNAAANNQQQNQLNNQFKNLQIDNGNGGNNNKKKGPAAGGNGSTSNNNGGQPKNVALPQGQNGGQNPQLQQQMKGYQDLKMPPPQMDMRMPQLNGNGNGNANKGIKLNGPVEEDLVDEDDEDEYDEDEDEEDFDDEMDDEIDEVPLNNKTKAPMMGNGQAGGSGSQMPPPNMMMMNGMMNGQLPPHLMKGGPSGVNNGGNAKNGGVNIPIQMNGPGANGGKKGGNNSGNQNPGGGKVAVNGGGGGGPIKIGGQAGAGGGAGGVNMSNFMANGGKKPGGMDGMPHGMMPNMMAMKGGGMGPGPMGNMPMGPMGNLSMAQMGMQPMNGGAGGGNGSGPGMFHATGPEHMAPPNPYHQQQLAAMMMNQQRANGNERFQPMMYARQPPAVTYVPPSYSPYPYQYPYPPPPGERGDQYTMFSDENASSCTIM